jgi:hypothetical protein
VDIPLEAYSAELSDYQFRLLAVLCHKTGSEGFLKASIADLGTWTGKSSDKTVRTALKALEKAGLLTIYKSRRANGFQGINTYKVTVKNYRTEENVTVKNYRTSHDYKSLSNITNKPLVPNGHISNQLKESETEGFTKEIIIPMRKWEDDGDNLAGFGLVEERDAPQPKIRKSDPKTRGRRPEHEWTPLDVASEFSFRVGRKFPLLPGTVNVRQLAGALSKFRKQYETNALIELELLRLFMADERNFKNVGDEAPMLYKMFLASFKTKINQARENLGLAKISAPIETVVKMGTLTASDGRVFQNSLSGRVQLDRYEKRLKEAMQ